MNTIFKAHNFTSYQCDSSRAFYIDVKHKMIKLSFCQLLAFREQVKHIDLDAHFSGKNKHGIEILVLCNRCHIFIFDTFECIALKELMDGTFAMLELNSLLTTRV
ncbi:hypothetical protein [Salegentibacter sediminis]|uniref:hypothetical protein n=1 Tax=Salegentibacter sediminis TaxID=1930251 RepID=UPI0009BD0380|nr:hypothetical protein [Salegentibacter sediminis]